jgi:hypothetical protein
MGFTLLDGIVSLSCLGLSYAIYAFSHPSSPHSGNARSFPQAYILRSITSHARFLPVDSRHAFTYPVLSLLLPLSALESGQLSLLNGFLFSFGGIYGRILGMRSAGYLYDDCGKEPSIRKKLGEALGQFGIETAGEQMDDAWILTMPSYCGFEGINPLTVYFCYRKDGPELWIVVLEVSVIRSPSISRIVLRYSRSTIPLVNVIFISLRWVKMRNPQTPSKVSDIWHDCFPSFLP